MDEARYQNEPHTDVVSKVVMIDKKAEELALQGGPREGFINKLFPSTIEREKVKHELKLSATENEFREKALKIAREAQLLAIEEMYNDFLAKGKTSIRRERAGYILEQKVILERKIIELSDEFNQAIIEAYEKADKIKINFLREQYLEELNGSIESFHSLGKQLKDQFQNIINEGVKA